MSYICDTNAIGKVPLKIYPNPMLAIPAMCVLKALI